jgi:hypothetical protein
MITNVEIKLFLKERPFQKGRSANSLIMKSKPSGNKTRIIPIKQLTVKALLMFV